MRHTRDLLHNGLKTRLKHVRLNGHPEKRLPNTLNCLFLAWKPTGYWRKSDWTWQFQRGPRAIQTTCRSHVLEAMAVPFEWAKGTLRFTTGRMTTEEEIARAINVVVDAVTRLEKA